MINYDYMKELIISIDLDLLGYKKEDRLKVFLDKLDILYDGYDINYAEHEYLRDYFEEIIGGWFEDWLWVYGWCYNWSI